MPLLRKKLVSHGEINFSWSSRMQVIDTVCYPSYPWKLKDLEHFAVNNDAHKFLKTLHRTELSNKETYEVKDLWLETLKYFKAGLEIWLFVCVYIKAALWKYCTHIALKRSTELLNDLLVKFVFFLKRNLLFNKLYL